MLCTRCGASGESGANFRTSCGSQFLLDPSHSCPKCRSPKVVGARVQEKKLKELGLPKFTILGHQMCQNCGHIFEKRVPLWLCYTCMVIGIGLVTPFLIALFDVFNYPTDGPAAAGERSTELYGAVVFAGFGFMAILGSFRALRTRRKH